MAEPKTRVILVGASNLTRGISSAVGTAGAIVGGPAELLIAMGHGRSYGMRSTVLGRSLPGIVDCGLWDAVTSNPAYPTFALLTDIGNDVIYGASVPAIVEWVGTCVSRLLDSGAVVVVTLPPLRTLERLSPWRFHTARALFFPFRRLAMDEALARAAALHDGVRRLGEARGIRLFEPDDRWYGLDPIHPRRRHMAAAWSAMMTPWGGDAPAPRRVSASLGRWLRLRRLTPQRWWLLGTLRGRPQPGGRLADGTTISLF